MILRYLNLSNAERVYPVARYVMDLEETEVQRQLQGIFAEFEERHFDLKAAFKENYEKVSANVPGTPSELKKLLIGAYFTHEYSIQAAALFNPSIVPHPDQSGLDAGALRFILSLRATGEGHISSIAFQTGVVDAEGEIALDPASDKLQSGRLISSADVSEESYDIDYPEDSPLSSRILFPRSRAESNGMEDARFVQFRDKENIRYFGTYTAYNGRTIWPQLIETTDFRHFCIRPLHGKAASDKGMALFPEKINGRYAMISRQGGRELSIMYSDDIYRWDDYQPLQTPQREWEMLQMGNCGSPIKTPHGWLLLTHAVGPMRKYVLSLTLLDLDHPEKVIASLDQPLLQPDVEEREGYVPNVLYTCGMLLHGDDLVIPYAMSDSAIGFATVELGDVWKVMLNKNES
ncbi:MAG: glycoside hydrolase family 130 protein [Saprospiraceae bacterium]|nr:glycoside hydrolase family 130 protein [Saprospiraceae bacterium]